MIIVEGPDGAGKTTLVKALSEELNLRVWGTNVPREKLHKFDVKSRVWHALGNAVKSNRPPVIYDRLFFSELVYGPLLRGSCKFSQTERNLIMRTFEVYAFPVIFCIPPSEVVRENLKHHKHLPGVPENIDRVYGIYQGLVEGAHMVSLNVHTYDYTQGTTPQYVAGIINYYLQFREERECFSSSKVVTLDSDPVPTGE